MILWKQLRLRISLNFGSSLNFPWHFRLGLLCQIFLILRVPRSLSRGSKSFWHWTDSIRVCSVDCASSFEFNVILFQRLLLPLLNTQVAALAFSWSVRLHRLNFFLFSDRPFCSWQQNSFKIPKFLVLADFFFRFGLFWLLEFWGNLTCCLCLSF